MNVNFLNYFIALNLVLYNLILLCRLGFVNTANQWSRVNLPDEQLEYFFNLNQKLSKKCENDELCPYKDYLNRSKCYGFERNCKSENQLFLVECPGDSQGWVSFVSLKCTK